MYIYVCVRVYFSHASVYTFTIDEHHNCDGNDRVVVEEVFFVFYGTHGFPFYSLETFCSSFVVFLLVLKGRKRQKGRWTFFIKLV